MRKSTWILLGIVVVLGAVIFFWERKQPSTDERADMAHQLVRFKSDAVTRAARSGFEPVTLDKGKDDKWTMTEPVKDAADGSAVEGFLDRIAMAKVVRKVEKGASDKALGLDPPRAVWTFTTPSGPVSVEVGDKAALGAGVYVRTEGSDFLLPSGMESLLLKSSSGFRLRELLPVGTQQISAFAMTRKDGPPLAFARNDKGFWNLSEPYADWGSSDKLQDALDDVSLCPVFHFVEGDGKNLPKYGLQPARTEMHLTLAGGGKVEVRLGAPVPGSKPEDKLVYAWASDRPSVMEISMNSLKNLEKAPDTFRSMACFRHDLYSVDSVDVRGLYHVRIARDAKKGWRFADPAHPPKGANAAALAAGIADLSGASAVPLEGSPPPGLNAPVMTVTLKGKEFKETLKIGGEVGGSRYALPGGRKTALILTKKAWMRVRAALQLVAGESGGKKP